MSYRAQQQTRLETNYVIRNMFVYNACWKVSDREEEGNRKVTRDIGVEDVNLTVLPRFEGICADIWFPLPETI
jgi:hypothetical protein